MTPMRRASVVVSFVVLAMTTGCASRRPVRLLAGRSDTVIVNTSTRVQVPVSGVDAKGRVRTVRGLQFEWLSGDRIALSRDGDVSCLKPGEAVLRAWDSHLSTRFVLLCRPVKGFRPSGGVELVVGAGPQRLPLYAVGFDDKPVTQLVGAATIENEGVADLEGPMVYARAPGETEVHVEIGDCALSIPVWVYGRATDATAIKPNQAFFTRFRLTGGESHRWHITPATYHIALLPDSGDEADVILGGNALNCVPHLGEADHTWCVALRDAEVVVGNARSTALGSEASGTLYIIRQYDPDRDTGDSEGIPSRRETRRSRVTRDQLKPCAQVRD
jgi:hypothetical protein